MKIQFYYLRDPNCGSQERADFERDSQKQGAIESVDNSGPAEGTGDTPLRSADGAVCPVGLGAVVFVTSGGGLR
jgi:hypothetical protein